eukprot:UC4_evm1s815
MSIASPGGKKIFFAGESAPKDDIETSPGQDTGRIHAARAMTSSVASSFDNSVFSPSISEIGEQQKLEIEDDERRLSDEFEKTVSARLYKCVSWGDLKGASLKEEKITGHAHDEHYYRDDYGNELPVLPKGADLKQRIYSQQIQVETINPCFPNLVVSCRANNIGYEKAISALYTLDDWKSVSHCSGMYVPSTVLSDGTDRFSLAIPIEEASSDMPASPQCQVNVSFCLKYEVNGGTHWDNNQGLNYNVQVNDI